MSRAIDKFGRKRKGSAVGARGLQGIQGPEGIGYKLSPDGHYDMQGKRLKNTGVPIDESDCVTQSYLYEQIKETKALTLKALQAAILSTMAKVVPDARLAFNDKISEMMIEIDHKYKNLKSEVDIRVSDATSAMTKKYDVLEERFAALEKEYPERWLTQRPRMWAPVVGSDPDQ